MICKECGAYNAAHLTQCRVCDALLFNDAAAVPSPVAAAAKEESGDHPAREFAPAPNWPKRAFTGAPENPPIPASTPLPHTPLTTPLSSARPNDEPTTRLACSNCGKATLADAPFCAYCGAPLSGSAANAAFAPASVPKPARRPASTANYRDDDYDEDDYDEDDYREDDYRPVKRHNRIATKASAYDDEDDYDEEEYDEDEEFDDMPKKRGKGTSILFWGLIIVLIAVIGVCAKVIADRSFGGDFRKMLSSIGTFFGREAKQQPVDSPDDEPSPGNHPMYTASISPYTDESGKEYYKIVVYAPTGSSIQVISNVQMQNNTATVSQDDIITLQIPAAIFLPNAPCETETFSVTPNIQATTPDGQTIPIAIDPITVRVPLISLELESPSENTVQATFHKDPVAIIGIATVPDLAGDGPVEVYINGQQISVDEFGRFSYNYTPTIAPAIAAPPLTTEPVAETPGEGIGQTVAVGVDDTTVADDEKASDDTPAEPPIDAEGERIVIEARKNNCVTAKRTILIEPYVFQNMALLVTNDPATGLGSKTGAVTLQGTVTPGATIVATCDSDKVIFGAPVVQETGNFSIAVTISTVGAYTVTLTATQEGFNETTTTTFVERRPSIEGRAFQKSPTTKKLEGDFLAKVLSGAVTTGDVKFRGTITEILGTNPYTYFKVKLADGTEVVCVNRSESTKITSSNVRKKKDVCGTLFGFYNDSEIPLIWVWFLWNP